MPYCVVKYKYSVFFYRTNTHRRITVTGARRSATTTGWMDGAGAVHPPAGGADPPGSSALTAREGGAGPVGSSALGGGVRPGKTALHTPATTIRLPTWSEPEIGCRKVCHAKSLLTLFCDFFPYPLTKCCF